MLVQSLDGAWELRGDGLKDAVKAQVPGCVHLDLTRAKMIEDPFVGDNEYKVAWVHETDWEYSRTFAVDEALLLSQSVYLECDGLDTIAEISLNGERIGRTDNMYIQHRFDVTGKLTPGENDISIKFASPVNHVKPLLEKDPMLSPNDSIPGAIYLRKCPSQFGWDWGPKLPTSGMWRSIRLAGYDDARIEDLRIRQNHRRNSHVTLDIEVSLEKFKVSGLNSRNTGRCVVSVTLTHPDGKTETREAKPISSRAKVSFTINNPKLWWPNGYGGQPLYDVRAALSCGGDAAHEVTRRVGLRTIKLEQKKDKFGRGFTFVVNGVPVFGKGADWIPADQFPARLTDENYRHLIHSAKLANMNMLRVWGGGFYEDERFYDFCDEYGILVWQDFMFACSLYPVSPDYLENVRREAEHEIKRLRNRACLALWCGNNEIEWFIEAGWAGDLVVKRKKEYLKIFHELLPSVCDKFDPDTPYWPSSPSSGNKPFDDPNNQTSGDSHYWGVWHGKEPFTAYRNRLDRFQSEFGFESLPAYETVKHFAKPEDMNMTSHVMECHQKNSAGNGLILYYLAQTFRFPKNFEMMCYVTQLLQAEAMRYGVEHWRRNRGRCMGTLYWQYNDCWPVSSWAGIDFFGRWKALHYVARRFFAPISLSVMEEGTRAEIHVTNDTTKPARIEVRWSLETLTGEVLRKSKVKTRVEPEQDKIVADLDFAEELAGDMARNAVLAHELLVNGKPAGTGITPFVPTKHLELPKTKIRVEVKSDEHGPYLEVTSDKSARFVCLSVPKKDIIFSDNYFDLPAGRTVTVRVDSEIDEAALGKVKAYSLVDSYA